MARAKRPAPAAKGAPKAEKRRACDLRPEAPAFEEGLIRFIAAENPT